MKGTVAKMGLYWVPVLLIMLGIFLLSSTTSSTLDEVKDGSQFLPAFITNVLSSQYFVHPVEFGILSALTYRMLQSYQAMSTRLAVAGALAWAITYGVVDEFHQGFVAGRSSTLSDVGLDSGGAVLALVLILLVGRYRPLLTPR